MKTLKRLIKRNSHNRLLEVLASLGRSTNRLYENRNHDIASNGEAQLLYKIGKLKPSIIFDVGANTGQYALLAHKYCSEATIHSFEPVKDTFVQLTSNTSKITSIKPIQVGLHIEEKIVTINKYPSHTHASIINLKHVPYEKIGEEKIQLTTGDSYMVAAGVEHIDLLKLDIEGNELEALKGLKNALANKKIRVIQFEYGYINILTKNLLWEYYELLES
jgi:FkbM family methyltransferase